jgi:hypothetical protein
VTARLTVRLTPRADGDRIDGWTADGAGRPLLKVRTAAVPTDGKANAALGRLIAQALNVAPSAVRLASGAGARTKSLVVDGLDQDELRRRLGGP